LSSRSYSDSEIPAQEVAASNPSIPLVQQQQQQQFHNKNAKSSKIDDPVEMEMDNFIKKWTVKEAKLDTARAAILQQQQQQQQQQTLPAHHEVYQHQVTSSNPFHDHNHSHHNNHNNNNNNNSHDNNHNRHHHESDQLHHRQHSDVGPDEDGGKSSSISHHGYASGSRTGRGRGSMGYSLGMQKTEMDLDIDSHTLRISRNGRIVDVSDLKTSVSGGGNKTIISKSKLQKLITRRKRRLSIFVQPEVYLSRKRRGGADSLQPAWLGTEKYHMAMNSYVVPRYAYLTIMKMLDHHETKLHLKYNQEKKISESLFLERLKKARKLKVAVSLFPR
jgi:hypothetical protein